MPTLTDQALERIARKRAHAKMGWYIHAMAYVAVNAFLMIVAHASIGHRGWPVFPALGWGLGLALHGISVFVLGSGTWRERLVERERAHLLRTHDRAPGA